MKNCISIDKSVDYNPFFSLKPYKVLPAMCGITIGILANININQSDHIVVYRKPGHLG